MVELEDIGGESCEPVSGFSPVAYIGPWDQFDTLTDPKDLCNTDDLLNADNLAELVTITTDHTFKDPLTQGFTKMLAINETIGLTYTPIGEKGRKLYKNTATITISGSKAELLGFARAVKNGKYVFLFEEFGSGNMRQVGNKRFPAEFENIEGQIEALPEGRNDVVFTVSDKSKWPAAIYTGAINEKPAA